VVRLDYIYTQPFFVAVVYCETIKRRGNLAFIFAYSEFCRYCDNAPEYVLEAIQTTLDDLQLVLGSVPRKSQKNEGVNKFFPHDS
jgi:hypothetical protein